jgi:hypothetical protein
MLWGFPAQVWLYGVCLGLSLLLLVLSALSGADFDIDIDADFDIDGPDHGLAMGDVGLPRYSVLNPIALLAFLGGFGSVGLMAHGAGSLVGVGLALAAVGGWAISWIVFRLFVRVMLAGQGGAAHQLSSMVGKLAIVSGAIPVTGMGTIAYQIGGRRNTLAARTSSAESLPPGAEVVIVEMDRNVATVIKYEIKQRKPE